MRNLHTAKTLRLIIIILTLSLCACKTQPEIIKLQKTAKKHFSKKSYTMAIKYYRAAHKIKPKDAGIHYNLGLCFNALKMEEKATNYFVDALRYEKDDSKKISYERELEASYKTFYRKIEAEDTIESYERFLENFPEGLIKEAPPGRLDEMKYYKQSVARRLQNLVIGTSRPVDDLPAYYSKYDYKTLQMMKYLEAQMYEDNGEYVKAKDKLLELLELFIDEDNENISGSQEYIDEVDRMQDKIEALDEFID